MKKIGLILLGILGIVLLCTPVCLHYLTNASQMTGTDDRASEMIEQIAGPEGLKGRVPIIKRGGYEPSETAEPWLFTGQMAIGVLIFAYAIWAYRRQESKNRGSNSAKSEMQT